MSAGSGFCAGDVSMNLTRESTSFPNLTKNIITTGIIIVFNNLFRVWKVTAFITPALHTGYINSKQILLKTFNASLCYKGTEFL